MSLCGELALEGAMDL